MAPTPQQIAAPVSASFAFRGQRPYSARLLLGGLFFRRLHSPVERELRLVFIGAEFRGGGDFVRGSKLLPEADRS
jgi:hypothetical protein